MNIVRHFKYIFKFCSSLTFQGQQNAGQRLIKSGLEAPGRLAVYCCIPRNHVGKVILFPACTYKARKVAATRYIVSWNNAG